MHIVHTIPSLGISGGGPPRSVSELCNSLCQDQSCEVSILTAVDENDPVVPLHAAIRLHTQPACGTSFFTRLRSCRFGLMLKQVHAEERVAIVHQHGIWLKSSHEVTASASRHRIPLIIAPRGMLEPWALNNSKWKKKLAWALYQKRDLQRATAFHATAQSEAESIRRLGFKQPIAVIPNGIVLPDLAVGGSSSNDGSSFFVPASLSNDGSSFFVPGSSSKDGSSFLIPCSSLKQGSLSNDSSSCFVPGSLFDNEAQRTKHQERSAKNEEQRTRNKEQDRKTALFLSRINPKKGLPMLLDAWQRVAPEGWRLVIAGNDDSNHLPIVERKIRELGLQDQVEVAGPLFGAAKEAAYRNADLFVLPSYSENFGIVVAEALGYGVPVLTTTGCPWQELQTHGCGWWVEPTPEGIESGLRAALGVGGMGQGAWSEELGAWSVEQGAWSMELRAMGLRGRALVEEKYQWPGIAERMLEFYDWILNGGKQPDFVV
jgi:glycosyltransferase involved in cell wall biosynthesis